VRFIVCMWHFPDTKEIASVALRYKTDTMPLSYNDNHDKC